jgi:CheY-like chemotaxis protein
MRMGKNILLVDDDMDEPEIFMNALRDANIVFQCTWVSDADQALVQLERTVPDFIVLDFNMPKMNGIELLRVLKKKTHLQHIPVVMYSATMDGHLNAEAMKAGAAHCIRKPYDMQELPGLLKEFL